MFRLSLSAFCLFSCSFLLTSIASTNNTGFIFQIDNDLFTGSDRDYTNGIRFAYIQDLTSNQATHNWLQKSLYNLSGAANDSFINRYRYQNDDLLNQTSQFSWGIGLTQLMYTPDDSTALTAPEHERPYAGWLGLEFSLHVKNEKSASSVTLSVGTTGPNSYAQDGQNWIHENISSSPFFQGWESEVPGEMTINLHFDHKRKVNWFESKKHDSFHLDGYTEWGAAIGNFRTNAYIGGLIRGGYNLPQTYTTPRVQIGSYGHAFFENDSLDPHTKTNFSLFSFVGARGSMVLHDVTLNGPVFRNFDTNVDSQLFVGELLLGFGIKAYDLDISFARTLRSNEFHGQNKNQKYGSLQIRITSPW